MPNIINHVSNVNISSNEMLIGAILNRNFKKLYENDMNLMAKSLEVYSGMVRVLPYDQDKIYRKNELAWFVDYYLPPSNEEEYNIKLSELQKNTEATIEDFDNLKKKYFTTSLYLLRSLTNNNTNYPVRSFVDMVPVFDASGWKNEYPSGTIFSDYFDMFTEYTLNKVLYELHESNPIYHKFGEISSYYDLDKVVLATDLSNLAEDRTCFFCPNETLELDSTKTIVAGSMRVWDCGLIEYDIIFKLGDSTSLFSSYNPDGSENIADELDANYLNLENLPVEGSEVSEYDNRRYYLNDSDSDIFVLSGGINVDKNGLIQRNVNSKLNSFYGTIKFPRPFINRNYTIFVTNIPSAIDYDGGSLESNINNMVFVKKSMESVTAMLIIPTYELGKMKVLGENRFRCQISGRWK